MSQLMRININEQRAQIGLNITRSNLNINSPRAQVQIQQRTTQLQVNTELPTFSQNSERLRDEIGLSTSLRFARNFAAEGRRTAMQGIGRRARDGDTMARHQVRGSDPIPAIARSASMARLGPVDFNIGLMPRSIPELHWQDGRIDINFTRHSIQINSGRANLARISLSPGHAVSAYLQRRPHIDITAVPLYA